MPYIDPDTILTPDPGDVLTAAWCDVVRSDLEFLIDPPACSIYNSAAQSVANNTATVLTANSERYDNDSMHSTSSNTSRITIQTAGRYLLVSTVLFDADADGFRRVSILHNGTTSYGGISGVNDGSNIGVRLTAVRSLVLAAGDYVEATCLHTAGANLDATLEEFVAIFLTR